VPTASTRVLAGLAEPLGLAYPELMEAVGYEPVAHSEPAPPGAVKRCSNAHILEPLESLQRDVRELKTLLASRH